MLLTGTQLSVRIGGHPAAPLVPTWPGSYSFREPLAGTDARASFVRDETGAVRWLVTSVGVARRL